MAQEPRRDRERGGRERGGREDRESSEFIDKLVHINRVAKVVARSDAIACLKLITNPLFVAFSAFAGVSVENSWKFVL